MRFVVKPPQTYTKFVTGSLWRRTEISRQAHGKPGGIIACTLAHRATRIAYALVRDHATYNPSRRAGQVRGISSVPATGAGDAGAVHLQRPQRSEDERRGQ